ncbi:MAG: amidohydrolase [Candidatus Accumulibacter sp.]|nr:amidohydrolase [Accumulibacter sp.]
MNRIDMKNEVCALIDKAAPEIERLATSVRDAPELGYKETKTAATIAAFFRQIGIEPEEGLALTGVRARLDGQKNGPTIAIMAELDAVTCPDAPGADPETGAAHTCGHFLQLAMLAAAAQALKNVWEKANLAGNVVFFAVPAEEYVEIEYRNRLREEGKLHFLGGKQELIYRNEFAGIDMAMMAHSRGATPGPVLQLGESSNGFIGKLVRYTGRAAHAAASPDEGINALNAAMLGLMGVHALRETFRDDQNIRVHPIITKGGDLVNVVPADVRLETYVRGKTMNAIIETGGKIDHAFAAGGHAIGAKTTIQTIPGYLPITSPKAFNDLFAENALFAHPGLEVLAGSHFTASTDAGDLSHLMPVTHPFMGGVNGNLHGAEFNVEDFSLAVLTPAKAMALSVLDLLWNGAEKAHAILDDFKPLLTREQYIDLLDKLANTVEY